MWNSPLDLLRKKDLEIQNRFAQLQARYGRTRATLTLMLIGAGLGGTAMFYVNYDAGVAVPVRFATAVGCCPDICWSTSDLHVLKPNLLCLP